MYVELHPVELPEKVIRELQIGLVYLVDEKHHLLLGFECLPHLSELDIVSDIIHIFTAELAVVEPLHGIIHIEAVLRLRGGLDIPRYQTLSESLGHCLSKHRLASARFALYEKRLLERDGHIYCGKQFLTGDILARTLKFICN